MRRASIIGDSISTFDGCVPAGYAVYYQGERCLATGVLELEDTWWMQVIRARGWELLANASYSGSMVAGAGFPAGQSDQRIEALAPDGVDPDIIIAFIGINDYGWGGSLAQAAGRSAATPPSLDLAGIPLHIAGRAGQAELEEFAAAYDRMAGKLRARYPQAEIWCCTLLPGRELGCGKPTFIRSLRGISYERYNEAIRAAAAAHSCQLADLAAEGYDYESIDGTHPTVHGMAQLAALFERARNRTLGLAIAEPQALPSDLESSPFCDEDDCIGCEFARDAGNLWSLVCEKQLQTTQN